MVFRPPGLYDALNYRIMQWNVHSLCKRIDSKLADAELDSLESLLHAFFSDDVSRRDDLPAIQTWANRPQKEAAIEAAVHKTSALIRSGHLWRMRFAMADLLLLTPQELKHAFSHAKSDVVVQLLDWCHRAPTPMLLTIFREIFSGSSWDSLKSSTSWMTQSEHWPYDLKEVTKNRLDFWQTLANANKALSAWISEWVPLAVLADRNSLNALYRTLDQWVATGDTSPPETTAVGHAAAVRWALLQSLLTALTHIYDTHATDGNASQTTSSHFLRG